MSTIKQKKAAQALSENIGSIGEAMRMAGYSKSTSKTPQRLTESDGWKELISQHIPDDTLLKVHKEGLEANDNIVSKDGNVIERPDYAVRHKYLDTAYKLKGLYGVVEPQKNESGNTYNFIFSKEVQEEVKVMEARIKQHLIQKHETIN